jgi:hypothetical protein
MHGQVEFFVQSGNNCFDRLWMFCYLGCDRLQMKRVLGAEFGLTTTPRAGLQALNALGLVAAQPVVDDYLAATQDIGDLK